MTNLKNHKRRTAAFTMVEIVLSLAVIAVAMVAIIGVLPLGMNVESENRENSIVSADAAIWMEALRNGSQDIGYILPFLLEAEEVITVRDATGTLRGTPVTNYYSRVDFNSSSNLLSLLSQPKYRVNGSEFIQRDVYVDFRALNGNMGDLTADDDFSFKYRMTPELIPKEPILGSTNLVQSLMQTNLFELRLHFGWPLVVGQGGNYRGQSGFRRELVFRTLVSGNQVVYTNQFDPSGRLFFVKPRQFEFSVPPQP